MRLWSFHPCYLDAKGLVALWREGLLAQKVLLGQTKGYKHHPQLERFKQHPEPVAAIGAYLSAVLKEAEKRNYDFNRSKILSRKKIEQIQVNNGQIRYEFDHFLNKLWRRERERYDRLKNETIIKPHPLFVAREGSKEAWEKSGKNQASSFP